MTTKLTAYQWLTSKHPAAVAWREQATMEAWNKVYARAEREQAGTYFTKPVEPIERPPTGQGTKQGRYFTLPRTDAGKTGTYFTIPAEGESE